MLTGLCGVCYAGVVYAVWGGARVGSGYCWLLWGELGVCGGE